MKNGKKTPKEPPNMLEEDEYHQEQEQRESASKGKWKMSTKIIVSLETQIQRKYNGP